MIDTPKGQPNKEERIDGIVDKTHNKAGNNLNLSKFWETVGNRSTWHAAVHGVTKVKHDLGTAQQQKQIWKERRENENQ